MTGESFPPAAGRLSGAVEEGSAVDVKDRI